jgi:LEA14-like dessication related protein
MHYLKTAVLLFALFLSGCKSFQPVEVGKPTDLRVASISGSKVNLKISVPIKNPNIYSIRVTHIQASAYINKAKVGEITNRENIRLDSRSDEIHDLKLDVDISSLFSTGLNITGIMKKGEVDFSIKGDLTTRTLFYQKTVPFSRRRTLTINR